MILIRTTQSGITEILTACNTTFKAIQTLRKIAEKKGIDIPDIRPNDGDDTLVKIRGIIQEHIEGTNYEIEIHDIPQPLDHQTHDQPTFIEISVISQIILDNWKNEIYKRSSGIIDTYERISALAVRFYEAHFHIQDWEDFISSDRNKYPQATDWTDYIAHWTFHRLD